MNKTIYLAMKTKQLPSLIARLQLVKALRAYQTLQSENIRNFEQLVQIEHENSIIDSQIKNSATVSKSYKFKLNLLINLLELKYFEVEVKFQLKFQSSVLLSFPPHFLKKVQMNEGIFSSKSLKTRRKTPYYGYDYSLSLL